MGCLRSGRLAGNTHQHTEKKKLAVESPTSLLSYWLAEEILKTPFSLTDGKLQMNDNLTIIYAPLPNMQSLALWIWMALLWLNWLKILQN